MEKDYPVCQNEVLMFVPASKCNISFVNQAKHSRSSSETHGNSSENKDVKKIKGITGNSSGTLEIQVKQIIFHYIIFNSSVQFSHYSMPAFTRRPVSAYAKARLCEAYSNGEDFVKIARILKVN